MMPSKVCTPHPVLAYRRVAIKLHALLTTTSSRVDTSKIKSVLTRGRNDRCYLDMEMGDPTYADKNNLHCPQGTLNPVLKILATGREFMSVLPT
jgi:hypothetical protein